MKLENLIHSVRLSSVGSLSLGNASVSMALLHVCSFSSALKGSSQDKWYGAAPPNELAEFIAYYRNHT